MKVREEWLKWIVVTAIAIAILLITSLILGETKVLAWQAGIVDPPDLPAPDGFFVYLSNDDTIIQSDPSTYIKKIDVGLPPQYEFNGELWYGVTTTWCGKYKCFAVSAYKIYGITPFEVRIESGLSNIACYQFGICIDPDSPTLDILDLMTFVGGR